MVQSSIATIAGILSFTAAIITLIMFILVMRKYFNLKKNFTLYLAASIFSWMLSFVFVSYIFFLSEWNLEWAIWCQKLVYVFVFLGIMFSFQFSQGTFFNLSKNKIIIYWIIGIIIIILTLILDSVEISEFPDESGYPLLTIGIIFSILVVVYIIPTVFGILFNALKVAKTIPEEVHKMAFKTIALGQIFIFCIFIVDTVATLVTNNITLYSLMLYLTWIFPMLALVCYYIGWIMPPWFQRKFSK